MVCMEYYCNFLHKVKPFRVLPQFVAVFNKFRFIFKSLNTMHNRFILLVTLSTGSKYTKYKFSKYNFYKNFHNANQEVDSIKNCHNQFLKSFFYKKKKFSTKTKSGLSNYAKWKLQSKQIPWKPI